MCQDCQKSSRELEEAVKPLHVPECITEGAKVQFVCICGWRSHVHSGLMEDPEMGPAALYREWMRHAKKFLCEDKESF